MPSTIRVSTAKLRHLYEVERLSSRRIGELLGCPRQLVERRLHDAGVVLRTRSEAALARSRAAAVLKVSKVRELYLEGLSTRALADHFGIAKGTICRFMKLNGIRRRRHSYAAFAASRYKLVFDVKVLCCDYEQRGMSLEAVAKYHGIGEKLARRVLVRFGVTIRENVTKLDIARAIALFNQGLSIRKTAKEIGCSVTVMRKHLLKHGVTLRSKSVCVYSNSAVKAA